MKPVLFQSKITSPKKSLANPLISCKTLNADKSFKTHSQKHKKIIFILLIASMLGYAVPSQASIFNPLLKILIPIYHKVIGKNNDNGGSNIQESHQESLKQIHDFDAKTKKDTEQDAKQDIDTTPSNPTTKPSDHGQDMPAKILTENDHWQINSHEAPSLEAILHAEFAYDRNNPHHALAIYKQQAFRQNATAVFERALALSLQLEPAEQTLQFARAWQAYYPDHIPAWFYVTHLSLKAGDYATTANSLQKILHYDQKADLSGIFAGILPNDRHAQRRLFDTLMQLDHANNASLSALKSALLVQLNEIDAAILHINHAIELDNHNLALHILKADILKQANRYHKLNHFLNQAKANASEPNKKQLVIYQIRTLIDLGKLTDAWSYLLSATTHYHDDSDLLLLASLVALDIQKYDDAKRLLNAILANPKSSDLLKSQANYYLGLSYERSHDYQTARSYYEHVTDATQKLDATRKVVGYYLLDDNVAQAIDTLISLRKDYPMFAGDSYLLQADILVRHNNKPVAILLLTQAFEDYPDDTRLLFSANTLLDDAQDYQTKLNNINRLVEMEPSPIHQLEQARLLLLSQPNDAHALQIAQEFKNDPEDEVRTKAQVLLADKDLATGNFQAVIDRLSDLYQAMPTLSAGARLLRAYNGLNNEHMVDSMLLDLTVRFGQDSDFNNSVQDY